MKDVHGFRVPRSRVVQTHRQMCDDILQAVIPILFGPTANGVAARAQLEADFAAAVQQRFAHGVHSGTIGLFLGLRACGIDTGDEVITVGNSDISTTAAVSHCGAVPVLVDVLESDYTIDPALVEAAVTDRTRAILPVDLYGHPADVKSLREIADQHGLKIIEDAALATGASDYGMPVGAYADATIFSFAAFKPLGCVGNGAMVTTNDETVFSRLRLLAGYGHEVEGLEVAPGHQAHVAEGLNVPIDPLQAALLRVKLPYLEQWSEKRRSIAEKYAEGLSGMPVQLPHLRSESASTFRSYTIRVENQPRVYQTLRAGGIEVVLHYAPPIYEQAVYPDGLRGADSLPVTDRLVREIICLPVTVELDDDDVTAVVEAVRQAVTAN
jgi:dTDP-4-amino-4,6-dideoxygalactose transaminase